MNFQGQEMNQEISINIMLELRTELFWFMKNLTVFFFLRIRRFFKELRSRLRFMDMFALELAGWLAKLI